jgi:hypothetical protein
MHFGAFLIGSEGKPFENNFKYSLIIHKVTSQPNALISAT